MTFTESNTVEAYLRDLLCGSPADENPLDLQDARATYGVASTGVGWTYLPGTAIPREPHEVFAEPLVREALIRLNPEIAAKPERAEEVLYKLRAIALSVRSDGLILANFVLFATDKKKRRLKVVCRYQQYEAANRIVERVVAGQPKRGLIWHFQGSGKSLLMVFAAQKLRMHPALPNAFLFGLTGTPINTRDRNTFYAFGAPEDVNGSLSRYGFEESIRDGATLPLYFEPRLVALHIDKAAIDQAYSGLTGSLSDVDRDNLDKPLRDHTLLQAISRTNRTYGGGAVAKSHGLIVDYLGVFDDVAKALDFDEAGFQRVASNIAALKDQLPGAVQKCLAYFPGVDRALTGYEGLIAAQECLPNNAVRDAFARDLSLLNRLWEALSPDPALQAYEADYRWLVQVYESVKPAGAQGALLWHALGAKTVELIHQNVHVAAEKARPPEEDEDRGKAALTALFEEARSPETPVMVERVVNDIDAIVRVLRFPGWQQTSAGEREVKKALRGTLFKYKLHSDAELFEKAYGYIRQYY